MQAQFRRPDQGERYTRVAIGLHWAIAVLIICNLVMGFYVWDYAKDFLRRDHPGAYFFALTLHQSIGITVLLLTVMRILWRLMHQPPPFHEAMKPWERHSAHFVHFLLYGAMLAMPMTGWMLISANPPAGSPGAQARMAAMAAAAGPGQAMPPRPDNPANPGMGPGAGSKPGGPPKPGLWFVGPQLPAIAAFANVGYEASGVKAQAALHDEFSEWHETLAWMTVALLLIHLVGAMKHEWIDRHPTFSRMWRGRG